MSELWWCVTCHAEKRFAVFDHNGFRFLCCQSCGGGICIDPEPGQIEESA